MARARSIDERTFRAVKIMLAGKASYAEIMEFLGVSKPTVTRINNSETFEEFKKQRQAEAFIAKKAAEEKTAKAAEPAEQPVQIVEHRQSVTIQATEYMMRELKQQNEYLRIISNKLCAIIDDLYGTGSAK